MGNSCSSGGGVAAPPMRELSALEVLTANKVKEYITKHRVEASKTLDQIVLKFPAILKAFDEIRVIFKQIDTDANGTIEKNEFLAACEKMKVGVEDDIVNKIYEDADINQKGHVDYKEFILMITVLFLMTDKHVDGEEATLINNAVQKVLEAFLFFDKDGDGYIMKEEVAQIMHEWSSYAWEMDWDQSGRVTFKEFLFAVEGWVGLEDEDEE